MNLPTAGGPLVGVVRLAHQPTTRRRAAVAAMIPGSTMRRSVRCAPSQGHPAAHSRCAVPTREYQSGGRPTHSAATRRASSGIRDPPHRPSRPFARFLTTRRGQRRTSSLRCGRSTLTPPTRRGTRQLRREGQEEAQLRTYLTGPFHISALLTAVSRALIWGSRCPVGRVRQPLQPSLEGLPLTVDAG